MKSYNQFKLPFISILAGTLLISSCGGTDPGNLPPPPPVSWYTDITGVWQQQGYGNVMEIAENSYSLYQNSQVTCIRIGSWSLDSLDNSLRSKQKNTDFSHITFEYLNNYTYQRFDKLTELPDLCKNGGNQVSNDPELNFEVLWNTINEQYAFFGLKQVSWDEVYGFYRDRINAITSQEELFTLFKEMLFNLEDGHVSVSNSNEEFKAGLPSMLLQRIYDDFSNQSQYTSLEDYINQQLNDINGILVSYLDGQVVQGANDQLAWGKLSGSVGYLMVKQMTNFTTQENENVSDLDNLEALKPVIKQAMSDLLNTDAMVIDLRLNGGGQAISALEIASYFIQQSTPVFTVSARFENDFTEQQVIKLEPATSSVYSGPLIILTSGITASASEIFIVSMLERGQVILVGETTEGIFSSELQKQLPNGWNFTLSNEIYQSIQGENFEAIGILPDVQQTIFPLTDRITGIDTGLDTAIELLTTLGIY
jgi:carboxyl-terminal processing protease